MLLCFVLLQMGGAARRWRMLSAVNVAARRAARLSDCRLAVANIPKMSHKRLCVVVKCRETTHFLAKRKPRAPLRCRLRDAAAASVHKKRHNARCAVERKPALCLSLLEVCSPHCAAAPTREASEVVVETEGQGVAVEVEAEAVLAVGAE